MSGSATLGDPSLNAFHESNLLNLLTKVSSQLYPRCLRVFAILRFSNDLLLTDIVFDISFFLELFLIAYYQLFINNIEWQVIIK